MDRAEFEAALAAWLGDRQAQADLAEIVISIGGSQGAEHLIVALRQAMVRHELTQVVAALEDDDDGLGNLPIC